MGRKKLEIKLIEDKNKRQVAFSKRREGLAKKARQLSALCDVDAAVIVFSSRGKLYEYCSGNTNSMEAIISRYHKSCLQAEEGTSQQGARQDTEINNLITRFRTCNELLETAKRIDEGHEMSVSDMTKLEEELNDALMHARARKTQLLMEQISTSREQERKLTEEKEELKQLVASAKAQNDDVDNGGGFATNLYYQTDPTQQLQTLPLFKD